MTNPSHEAIANEFKRSINVILPGYHRTFQLNTIQYENTFRTKYQPHLTFLNEKTLRDAIVNCPRLTSKQNEENHHLYLQFQKELETGFVASCTIQWIDDQIGYGLFANQDLEKGAFFGEYTGVVRRLYRFHPDQNAYCVYYPTKWWSWKSFAVDALKEGNELRFINHSEQPNLVVSWIIDRGIVHQVFFAKRAIKKGEQLWLNYGPDFWRNR